MLSVFFGDREDVIDNPEDYFNGMHALGTYSFMSDPLIKAIISDVDQSEVLDNCLIKSPVLGLIPPMMLSGGVKTLIDIYLEPDEVFNASYCGNNCAKWILKIAENQDITIRLGHTMNFGEQPFKIRIENNGLIVTKMYDFVQQSHRIMFEV